MLALYDAGYRTVGVGTRKMKLGTGLLGPTPKSSQILVEGTVKRFERILREPLLVLVADVHAGFLKGVDERGISADIRHGLDQNRAHFSVTELLPLSSASSGLHREQIIPQ